MPVNGRATRPITWQEFVELCILERLSRGGASLGELLLLNLAECRFLLSKYSFALTDFKGVISPADIDATVKDMLRRGLVAISLDWIALTSRGYGEIPKATTMSPGRLSS